MQLSPYLSYKGQCEAAFKFYEQCLGAKILEMKSYEGSPMAAHLPPDWKNAIIHGRIKIGDVIVMGSDHPPDRYETPKGITMALSFATPAEADNAFHALAKNGTVQMPVQETFWALRFGMLVDQFGITWMVNCDKPV